MNKLSIAHWFPYSVGNSLHKSHAMLAATFLIPYWNKISSRNQLYLHNYSNFRAGKSRALYVFLTTRVVCLRMFHCQSNDKHHMHLNLITRHLFAMRYVTRSSVSPRNDSATHNYSTSALQFHVLPLFLNCGKANQETLMGGNLITRINKVDKNTMLCLLTSQSWRHTAGARELSN